MLTWFLKLKDLKKPITLMQFNFILAIWLGLVLNFGFFEKINQLTPYKGMKSMLFLGATLIVIVAIYNLLLQLISWKWSAKFFASLLIIIGGQAPISLIVWASSLPRIKYKICYKQM